MKIKVKIIKQDFSSKMNVIEVGDVVYCFSYTTCIAIKNNTLDGRVILDKEYWDYSSTTRKHRNAFLCEDKSETLKKIKSGQYLLEDLN